MTTYFFLITMNVFLATANNYVVLDVEKQHVTKFKYICTYICTCVFVPMCNDGVTA
jgi:hypothetical protein